VQACLRGFELGETICAPPLPDPALFARLEAAERDVLVTARMTQLAERYR
jgi:hypothetical protein